jgi:hypothetical protein
MRGQEKIYLHTRIYFGRYRHNPKCIKSIINEGAGGVYWLWWLISNSYKFKPEQEVLDYLHRKANEYGIVLQQE